MLHVTVYIYKNEYLSVCLCVLYAFLNSRTDVDEIWYKDKLDLWAEDKLILK